MNTRQIAEEAAEQIKTDVSDVIIDKELLTSIIQVAIEKATEHDKQQIYDLKRQLESWMHTATRAQLARNEALEKLESRAAHASKEK